jgi:hypothetical protein
VKFRYFFAQGHHLARQFVAEQRRGDNHARMVTASENLHIGSAGQRCTHFDKDIARSDCRNGNLLDAEIFLAVQYGRHHMCVHS